MYDRFVVMLIFSFLVENVVVRRGTDVTLSRDGHVIGHFATIQAGLVLNLPIEIGICRRISRCSLIEYLD